jgi:nucleoside-diphosphate-sugar epimerase
MTEATALTPCSKKGQARLHGWNLIEERVRAGQDVVVGRAADFLGKGVNTAVVPWKGIDALVRSNRRVRSLQWIGDPSTAHTYAYARDVARALVLLDQDPSSRQASMVHLPVVRAVTGNEIGAVLSDILGGRVVVRPIPAALMKVAAAISAPAREQMEMMYQVDEDFIFDDATFRKHQPEFPVTTIRDVFDADLEIGLPIFR